ncbi:DUF1929 domain-containing protein, partial [bacterium]|nr:DUF1929 domain-containing protein [bacterium]
MGDQIFYPPYLFDGNSWADRASIVDYPHPSSDTIVYGLPFQIGMTDSAEAAGIDEIALMRPSAPTHASDFSQCRVRLSHAVLPDDPDRLVVAAPKDSTYAPAGYYLLFAL